MGARFSSLTPGTLAMRFARGTYFPLTLALASRSEFRNRARLLCQ